MLQTAFIRICQILLLAAGQVLVCNRFHLFGYATPMIGVLLLAYIPINANRSGTMCWAFLLGAVIDFLSATPGQSSAALTLAAFCQQPLLKAMAPKERGEDFVASYRSLGVESHIYFLLILTCIHNIVYVALEFMTFFRYIDMLLSMLGSVALSMVVILTLETARDRKKPHQATAS